jgi:DNA-binding MarR family transcriptional regulator
MKGRLPSTPQLPCFCASFRRASRALTQLYDEALRPLGIRGTQFTILQALSLAGEISQGELGQFLVMDSTTLTRTLRILSQNGWIEDRPGEDRRVRLLGLTKAGQHQFKRGLPHWEKVQTKLRNALGSNRWNKLMREANDLTNVITATIEN